MASRRSGSATAPSIRPRDPGGSWGRSGPLAPPSQSSWALSVGDFSGAHEKSSAIGQPGPSQALLSWAAHPSAAREDARPALGEAKKKNLSEGFLQTPLTSPPSREPQPPAGTSPKSGKVPLVLGALLDLHGTGAGCGIRSVLNPVERVAGARKSPSAGAWVALLARTREFAGSG